MPVADAVQTIINVLTYVLPAVFLWAMTDRIVRSVVRAATGGKWGL